MATRGSCLLAASVDCARGKCDSQISFRSSGWNWSQHRARLCDCANHRDAGSRRLHRKYPLAARRQASLDRSALLMTLNGARVLYISYNGMLDPLGQSQVIPYLKQLNQRGVEFTLLSFERPEALAKHDTEIERVRSDLATSGIDWHWLRYHRSEEHTSELH